MRTFSKALATGLFASGGSAVKFHHAAEWSKKKHDSRTFSNGQFVETWNSEQQMWLPSTYLNTLEDGLGHQVARWDDGVMPQVPHDEIRYGVPFYPGEGIQLLDTSTSSWLTGVALANASEPNFYELELKDYGKLKGNAYAMRRTPVYKKGDHIRYKDDATSYWIEGNVKAVIHEGNDTLYNLTLATTPLLPRADATHLKRFEHHQVNDSIQWFDLDQHRWWDDCRIVELRADDKFNITRPDGANFIAMGGLIRRTRRKPWTVFGVDLPGAKTIEYFDNGTRVWTPGKVLGKGYEVATYNIIVPMYGEKQNISQYYLRTRPHFAPGTIGEVLDTRNGAWMKGLITGDGQYPETYHVSVPKMRPFLNTPEIRVRRYVSPAPGERMEIYDEHFGYWSPCDVVGPDEEKGYYTVHLPDEGKLEGVFELNLRRRARVPRSGYAAV